MNRKPTWRRKYVWLPALLSIYFIAMATWFGRELLTSGRTSEFVGICAGEILVLALLVIFLKKRDKK